MVNLTTTRNADIDKTEAIRYLKNERRNFENKKLAAEIDQLNEQMDALGDVDGDLEAIREERREELDAYNMEIARLKREARQLVNEKDAAIPDEDEDRTRSHIFLDVEALDDDEEFRPKTQKKLTDNIFIIMLTGILVVAAVMLAGISRKPSSSYLQSVRSHLWLLRSLTDYSGRASLMERMQYRMRQNLTR